MGPVGLPVDQLPDEVLLAGYGQGDPELAVAFVRRFQSAVFGVALAVTGDRRAAEDVAQQAFERAWRHAGAYDPRRATVGGWLRVITRRLAIDEVRVRVPVPIDLPELLARTVGTGGGPGPEAAAVSGDAVVALRAALRHLPHEQATAVVLAVIAGLSAGEIAEREGIPLGTAKTRIRTALRRLRHELVQGADHA